jgi:hypothetical protein
MKNLKQIVLCRAGRCVDLYYNDNIYGDIDEALIECSHLAQDIIVGGN